ncbi:phosphatidylcholine:ceramide cholinephosphotransferase 2-like [Synchiropus splendidus]|uniref:phosphatidylcholine:ceramide cholinephosphotransferase 2-like n=1 Tax=Synchiropus splendidus TaxID=270530 RepID=UPI00237D8495|nr:phosphatidylcholine:ceramide cholinephosphotransferase 2-like [Synchiropus splendidus]XP_053716332.1 phosphatidylcholine:ceramide cholinephosphotransferase 2-like [Synchiropus splendidus]XP_053716333.1 phosphatidylcholine:ceramide cholinephosphotransferase 2-like [Synchiropus splendidus]XP_053716334.1 phosphatidylcholine:ceramide cholinephosphotransferase 2-like [Synchiropus splendidus]XP_053716335.1 phosphatidylcholine:ceramide cholinephosphotransferase 2-like [Synchiropus splendidus]
MAASELIQDSPHVEAVVTTSNSPTSPSPRVANGTLARLNSSPSPPTDDPDGKKKCNKLSTLLQQNQLVQSLSNGLRRHCDYVKITVPEERSNRLPKEWWKTGVAFLYAVFNLLFTTVVITIVHERVPDKSVSPPLPDKFFDYVDRVPWAFTVTEVNGLILVGLWLLQWLFLKHRAIIGRRCFFLIGTLYFYRCVTMYITTLPVPGKHMVCAPKLYNDSTGKIWRILRLISGGGLSLTGSHLMCGDFLYSGHTVMLTLSYLFIKEYSPPWMRWYQWLCWLLSASGVICILIAHEHYSIDVVVGYIVTTRTFWWYHTMANTHALRQAPNNYLSRTWWNPVFKFLERNVQTVVPIEFSFPLPVPATCRQRYRIVEGGRDE